MTQYVKVLWPQILLTTLCIVASERLQAADILTVEDALNKCKDTYPTQLQAKKRLACFDSISTPAIEVKTEAISAGAVGGLNTEQSGTARSPASTVPANVRIPEAEIAIKKTNKNLSYLERN